MTHDPTIHTDPEGLRLRPGGNRRRPGPAAVPGPALDAIVLPMQTAKPWAHLPKRHGNWRGVYNRLRMWALDGTTWERVCTALMAQPDTDEDLAWAFSGLGPLAIEHVVDEGGRILVRVRTPEDKTRMLLHEAKENPFKMPWSSSALSTSPR